jgi:uncharacterized protein (DUF2147 family)
MRTVFVITLLLFCFQAFAQTSLDVVGRWKTIDDQTGKERSIVEIYQRNGKLYGKIIKVINPDVPNPLCEKCKGEKHNQPIEGLVFVYDLKANGKEYANGKILDPETGKEYDCKLWREGNTLKVRGYLGFFFRTQTWHLVS